MKGSSFSTFFKKNLFAVRKKPDFSLKRSIANAVLWVVSIGLLVITLLGFFSRWWVLAEILVSFRPIYFLFALLLLPIAALSRQTKIATLILLSLLINLSVISPYLGWKSHSKGELRLMLFNADRHTLPWVGILPIVKLIETEQPDIIVLLEIGEAQEKELQDALIATYPHIFAHHDIANDGTMILSKYDIISQKVVLLGAGRLTPIIELNIEHRSVQLICPHPTNALYDINERNVQLEAIANYVATAPTPLILAGDLNVTPWSAWYSAIENGKVRNARHRFGILPSWRTPLPFVYLPLDHVLTSNEFNITSVKLIDGLKSDHFPMTIDIAFIK